MSLPPEQEASYSAMIDSILATSDLNTISAKKIRKGLQAAVDYDLTPQKKKKRKTAPKGEDDDDAAFAARLQAEENSRARPTRGGATRKRTSVKKEKKATTRKKKSSNKVRADDDSDVESGSGEEKKVERKGGFHLLGETSLSRPQTVKKIWEYVKARDLQDPSDKRQIRCDEALRAVFKQDRVHMFTMNKILALNLYAQDE
ncbi:hypothetical protein LTR16_002145 [Cryomyces antarcticus]|uniref:DM2 domain-containing protein n=1 Tax=Cryomyces antarcticus TaxID=329879 RepID=A0ABR0LZ12_9PEZI|nr:hypothetical protein LTR16_002145 [Cryomyces antarcticus]